MRADKKTHSRFQEAPVNVRVKIAGLWSSAIFFYIYGDYFGLYVPGKLEDMQGGKIFPLGDVTQEILMATSLMMAIPCAMVFLSLLLRPALNRQLNIVFGLLYTLIALAAMWGWAFQIMYGVIESVITALIVWHAWRWPSAEVQASDG